MLCIRTIKIKDLISIIQIKIVKCSNFNNNKCLNSIRTCSKTPNISSNSSNNRRNISNNRDSSSKLIITHNNNNSNSRTFLKIISIITIWDITITWTLDNSNNISRCTTGSSTSNSSTCSRHSVLASDPGVLVALA